MTAKELTQLGWKPLTYPYTPQEENMLANATAQLRKGWVPYEVARDEHEGVEGWAVFTKPRYYMQEDV